MELNSRNKVEICSHIGDMITQLGTSADLDCKELDSLYQDVFSYFFELLQRYDTKTISSMHENLQILKV